MRTTKYKTVWIVHVRVNDEDPCEFGPYSELQAERVAARINAEVALATDRHGIVHHPSGVESATVMPMSRYEDIVGFLTAVERDAALAAAREADAP